MCSGEKSKQVNNDRPSNGACWWLIKKNWSVWAHGEGKGMKGREGVDFVGMHSGDFYDLARLYSKNVFFAFDYFLV